MAGKFNAVPSFGDTGERTPDLPPMSAPVEETPAVDARADIAQQVEERRAKDLQHQKENLKSNVDQRLDEMKKSFEKLDKAKLDSFTASHLEYRDGDYAKWTRDFNQQILGNTDPALDAALTRSFQQFLQGKISGSFDGSSFARLDGSMGAYTMQALLKYLGRSEKVKLVDVKDDRYQKALDSLVPAVSAPSTEPSKEGPALTQSPLQATIEIPETISKDLNPFLDRLLRAYLKEVHSNFEDRNEIYSEILRTLKVKPYPSVEQIQEVYSDEVKDLPENSPVRLRFEAFNKSHESYIPALKQWDVERTSPFFTSAELQEKAKNVRTLYESWTNSWKLLNDAIVQDRETNRSLDSTLKASLAQTLYPLFQSYPLPPDVALKNILVPNPNWSTLLDMSSFYSRLGTQNVPSSLWFGGRKAVMDFFAKHFPNLTPNTSLNADTLKNAAQRETLAALFKDSKTPEQTLQAIQGLAYFRNAYLLEDAIRSAVGEFLKNPSPPSQSEAKINVALNQ